MSLVHRYVRVSFSMGGTGGSSAGSLSFDALRISCEITLAMALVMNHARVSIYGMTLSEMNALSYVPWLPGQVGNNTILIEAGDPENGMSQVFEGTITLAWPNMQNAPEVSFDVQAQAGVYNGVRPANPPYLSFNGATDVATIAKKIAGLYDPPLTLQNNGVNMKLDSPYFSGSPGNMMQQLVKMTRIKASEDVGKKMVIAPQGGAAEGGGITVAPPIMVGYPAAVPGYIVVKKIFQRNVPPYTQVTVKSDIERANGTWYAAYVNHQLDNYLMPHNRWFSTLFCTPLGASSAPPPPTGG